MYLIDKKIPGDCPVLYHGAAIFDEARLCGAGRIHVLFPGGEDYDLVHISNADCLPDFIRNRWKDQRCYPEYETYSINESSSLYLDFFRIFRTVVFRSANEYTVALAEVLLRYTTLHVVTSDDRMAWFFKDRILCLPESELPSGRDVLDIGDVADDAVFDLSFHKIGPVCAFHNVFFLQGQGALSLSDTPFAELMIDEAAGIGSVLNNLYRFRTALASVGLIPVVRGEKVGHFRVSFLEQYFNLDLRDPRATETNTLTFTEMSTLSATMFLDWVDPKLDLSILRSRFLDEMKEYADAVLGQRRILGVLIRGTDYLIVHKDGPRKMAGVDQMIPMIREWIEEFGYEGIFLATEDSDVLARIRAEFGSCVRVIAQERHSVSDLEGHLLLAELEKKSASDYDASVIENTVNYFYALYMLSRCSAFLCSGPCNGFDLAVGFNGGQYERTHLFRNRP